MKRALMIPVWIVLAVIALMPGLFLVIWSLTLWQDVFDRGLLVVLASTNIHGWAALFAPLAGPLFALLIVIEVLISRWRRG